MKRLIFSILFALVLVLSFSLVTMVPVAAAATLTVDTSLPNTPPNYHTIQAAIDAAFSGDTITVAAGTYTEYLHITTDGLTIEGAGIDVSIIDLDGLTPYWHYPGNSSFASRAGVLISGYLSPGTPAEVVENVTFKGFTVKNAGLNPPITATGTHTGADDALVLTDSTKSWTPGALVDQWVHNYGDRDTDYNPARSYGLITANTGTTVTATLSGSTGTEKDWDTGDPYLITPYEEFHNTYWVQNPNYDAVRGISIANGKNILIQDCKVTDSGYGGITTGVARLVGTHKYSEYVTVDNCIVTDHPVAGISIGNNVGPFAITNNVVENIGQPHYSDSSREYMGHGIQVSGKSSSLSASGLISGNTVRNNGFEGIILKNYADGITIEDNTVTGHNIDNDGAGIFFYGRSSNPANMKNNVIRNNVVTGNIRGIVAYYAQESTIEGNIITVDSGALAPGQEGIKIDGGNNMLVKGNTIEGDDGTGIRVQNTWNGIEAYANEIVDNTITNMGFPGIKVSSDAHDNTFTGNTISGVKFAGVFIYSGAHDNTFTGNTIAGTVTKTLYTSQPYQETQGDGVFLWGYSGLEAGTGNIFHYNSIYGNADDGMENQIAPTVVDATYNWWGDVSGPYHPGSWTYAAATITNPSGLGDEVTDYVLYEPWLGQGGFVTGGGTIWSSAGDYIWNLTAEGEANFGFVAKYKKGANTPDGHTNFVFEAGGLHFRSSEYDWLVTAGDTAKFKGVGTIEGASGIYKFMIWAGDGDPDTFRIKIWEEVNGSEDVVYDNGSQQAITGGNIFIHKEKGKK